MNDFYLSTFWMDDCPLIISDYTEDDKKIDEMIQKAESIDELASIIADELVRTIKTQLNLK